MDLKIKDIVELLQITEKTLYKWIKENKIPAYRINHQYRFNKAEINDWILKNKITVSSKILDLNLSKKPVSLVTLLKRGGVFDKISGDNVQTIIKSAVDVIPIPSETNKEKVLYSLLEREDMVPTAMGHGVAFPHPHNPIIADIENENISICFLENEIDYKAMDGKLVHTLFIVLSANARRHLEILSKLSFLCQQDTFISLLKNNTSAENIFRYIEDQESEWNKRLVNNE